MKMNVPIKKAFVLLIIMALMFVALPTREAKAEGTVVPVYILAPSWTAEGGGGVFSAYVGPSSGYSYVSPGSVTLFDGREAGIIKAGLEIDPDDGIYEDEGLFGFIPNVTIENFALYDESYDVENQAGVNPVWMTIELDTGTVGDRSDNTVYQFVPTSNPAEWHTVDAAAGQWQKWNNNQGDTTGNPLIPLATIAATHPGVNVVRAYLRLGMGDSYNNGGTGTIAWVDKATIADVTYDFQVRDWYVATTGSDSNAGTQDSPFATIQHAVTAATDGDTIHVAAGTYDEKITVQKGITLQGEGGESSKIQYTTSNNYALISVLNPSGNVTIDGFDLVMHSAPDWAEAVVVNDATGAIDAHTVTISNNIVTGSNQGDWDHGTDFGFYAQGNNAKFVVTNNTLNYTGANSIMMEQHLGSSVITGNTIHITNDVYYDPILAWSMGERQ